MSFILDGRVLQLDTPFEHDGTSYPANWLRLSSEEQRAAIGITERPDYPRPDDRFYWVSENPNGTWNAVPKDMGQLKSDWSYNMRQTAYSLLASSDWLIIRKLENGTAVPANWTSYREAVRTTCELAIGDLEAATNIDAFIASVTSVQWPSSVDQ